MVEKSPDCVFPSSFHVVNPLRLGAVGVIVTKFPLRVKFTSSKVFLLLYLILIIYLLLYNVMYHAESFVGLVTPVILSVSFACMYILVSALT